MILPSGFQRVKERTIERRSEPRASHARLTSVQVGYGILRNLPEADPQYWRATRPSSASKVLLGELFDAEERARLGAALDAQVPGATALGAVDYVERLLTALDHDPPRIWAAPAGSGSAWIELGPWERQAWSQRIDELRVVYRRVLAGTASPGDERVLHAHACEAAYGDPAYGGNRRSGGWQRIGFPEPLFPPSRDT